uniref:Uncharacterized protein n=1 Tax=Trichuris muris TaxID=70415 RepID=A0A5S6QCI5_TRIMR
MFSSLIIHRLIIWEPQAVYRRQQAELRHRQRVPLLPLQPAGVDIVTSSLFTLELQRVVGSSPLADPYNNCRSSVRTAMYSSVTDTIAELVGINVGTLVVIQVVAMAAMLLMLMLCGGGNAKPAEGAAGAPPAGDAAAPAAGGDKPAEPPKQ